MGANRIAPDFCPQAAFDPVKETDTRDRWLCQTLCDNVLTHYCGQQTGSSTCAQQPEKVI